MSLNNLPNEIYFDIFDYLNPIDIIYSFSNLNQRINHLIQFYRKLSFQSIDLTQLNPLVFQSFLLNKIIHSKIESIKLNDQQFQLIRFDRKNQLTKLTIFLEENYHFSTKDLNFFENLKKLRIENNCLTWTKPFVNSNQLKQVHIHLKEHNDLIDLLNNLPIVELVHATINYDVTSCRETYQLKDSNLSSKLIDFSYEMNSKHGLVYFVTDYSSIELLVKKLIHLKSLRLYIIGCLNTIIDQNRLETNLLNHLNKLEHFSYFLQSYGGKKMKSMEHFLSFKYQFASYSNEIDDMFFYFTLPFQFSRLDQCFDQYFLQSIRTNFSKSPNEIEFEKQIGLNSIKHIDLNCSITLKLFSILQKSLKSLKSIRLLSSTSYNETLPLLSQQSKYEVTTVQTLIFDSNCRCQPIFLRLFPNLTKLIINQSLLNILLDHYDQIYLEKIQSLTVYCFQRHYFKNILSSFQNLIDLKFRTTLTDDEGPIRSFVEGRCLHKHRPISLLDTLNDLFQSQFNRLKSIEIGCFFERDQINLQSILTNLIQKYKYNQKQYFIQTESFYSTRCGTTKILFF